MSQLEARVSKLFIGYLLDGNENRGYIFPASIPQIKARESLKALERRTIAIHNQGRQSKSAPFSKADDDLGQLPPNEILAQMKVHDPRKADAPVCKQTILRVAPINLQPSNSSPANLLVLLSDIDFTLVHECYIRESSTIKGL